MRVWRIASETAEYSADDVSGLGAYRTGGRWNGKNRYVLYCAESASLACLETLVHLGVWNLPLKRYLVGIDIPDALWKSRKSINARTLPDGWNAFPAVQVSTNVGDDWLKRKQSAVLVVPSAIVPEDSIILINPQHPEASKIKAGKVRVWRYDQRLIGV
jgi:RES domain-containing protein